MKSKNKLWIVLGAAAVVILAIFLIVRTTGNGTTTGNIDNDLDYESMAGESLIDMVGEEVYYAAMNMVQFIKDEKFVKADFKAHGGDTQLALGEDYAIFAEFNEIYDQHLLSVANDSSSAENDAQYLLQTIGAGFSSQIQQKALMIQTADIEAEPEKWTHMDLSQMPQVIEVYAELAQDAVKAVESENMNQIKKYFDDQPWNDRLRPYADYLATFSEGLAVYE